MNEQGSKLIQIEYFPVLKQAHGEQQYLNLIRDIMATGAPVDQPDSGQVDSFCGGIDFQKQVDLIHRRVAGARRAPVPEPDPRHHGHNENGLLNGFPALVKFSSGLSNLHPITMNE